jgi:hypothetical protein
MSKTPSFQDFLNESTKMPTVQDADAFISDVLKLGSRVNLFDQFMKKEGINPNELTTLVTMVADRMKEKWS